MLALKPTQPTSAFSSSSSSSSSSITSFLIHLPIMMLIAITVTTIIVFFTVTFLACPSILRLASTQRASTRYTLGDLTYNLPNTQPRPRTSEPPPPSLTPLALYPKMPTRRDPFIMLQLLEAKASLEALLMELEAEWMRGHHSKTCLNRRDILNNLLVIISREIDVRQKVPPGLPKL
ncbi:hypothetical protein BO82DRAFT_365953 [Aspergillus uvarum CBS 121591]|uniref:Transmembrane protein n=1 Tax=Aspergillus uvarum CBS 121591 TaxID=1448315 RepID=A0A319DLS8_9EURO|nr:hypothetical protein BO82DRAFT_365953 [Aspergillus uvarum CBS 121591]PYH80382.1 hypothetical protein BO82DRAFT_365953 [Aspergillus uvarum CBS 121591]